MSGLHPSHIEPWAHSAPFLQSNRMPTWTQAPRTKGAGAGAGAEAETPET